MAVTRVGNYYDWVTGRKGPTAYHYSNLKGWTGRAFLSHDHSSSRDEHGIYHAGGPFLTSRYGWQLDSGTTATIWRPNGKLPAYVGSLIASLPDYPPPVKSGDGSEYGPELYRRATPDHPLITLGNAIYELKDLPGLLKGRFSTYLQSTGDTYLRYAFGWKPLIDDLFKLAMVHKDLIARYNWLIRNVGKPVHRTSSIDLGSKTSTVIGEGESYSAFEQTFVTQCYATKPSFKDTFTTTDKLWFKGSFRYWFDDMDPSSDLWRANLMRKLIGLDIKASYLYKAIPWTWCIDWFTNIGDNIANLQTGVADRLILDYGYIMRTTEHRNTRVVKGKFYTTKDFDSAREFTATSHTYDISKSRTGDAPIFGFRDKSDDPLSPFQASIGAALAASRSRKR